MASLKPQNLAKLLPIETYPYTIYTLRQVILVLG